MDGHASNAGDRGRSISLVIPAYNEEAVIAQALAEADEALERFGGDYEVLVIDDGSCDRTAEIVTQVSQLRPRVRLLQHAVNRGYGAALRTGFEASRFSHVAFTDADCQFDLADLASLLPHLERCPVVVGYRLDRQDPASRRFVSWGYNVLARRLLGTRVRDCDCALKVFRKECLRSIMPEARGFFVNSEMLAQARQLGLAVAEVGVRHRARLKGASKVSLADIPRTLRTFLPFWWSRVLFPGRPAIDADSRSVAAARFPSAMLALVLAMAALLFYARPKSALLEPEEARYAEIPRQMLEEGRVIVPVLHGQPYLQKPPMLYWLVMASYQVFGVEDWAARLVPCTAALLTLLVTYAWGRRALGQRAAFLAALILCLSARFVYLGRMLTFDSLLCLWVISSLAAAHVALYDPGSRRGWWFLSAVLCGLGILTKGPVAAVLVGLPIILYLFLDRRSVRPTARQALSYLLTVSAVAGPWYILAAIHSPDFLGFFFWTHNVVRFVAPYDHARPFWFYIPDIALGMLPWSLFLPPLAVYLCRHSRVLSRRRPGALGFFLLVALACIGFFSLSGCKRAGYVLPVFPALALALGGFLDAVLPRRDVHGALHGGSLALRRGLSRLAARAAMTGLILGPAAVLFAVAVGLCKPPQGITFAVIAALGFFLALKIRARRSLEISWGLCAGVTFGFLFLAVHQVLPGYVQKFSLRRQVRRQLAWARSEGVPVACFPHCWDSVTFYLGRSDVRVYGAHDVVKLIADLRRRPETLIFVKSDDQADRGSKHCLTDLRKLLPPSLEFVPLGKPGIATAGIVRRRGLPPDMLLAEN